MFNQYTIPVFVYCVQCELCLIIIPLKEYDVSSLPFRGMWEWGRAGPVTLSKLRKKTSQLSSHDIYLWLSICLTLSGGMAWKPVYIYIPAPITLNFEEIRVVWVPTSEWPCHSERIWPCVQMPPKLLLTLGTHNYANHWIPSHKNLKMSKNSTCLQIMPSCCQLRCWASININFKYILGVFRFFQTVKSAGGSGDLSRPKFHLQTSSDGLIWDVIIPSYLCGAYPILPLLMSSLSLPSCIAPPYLHPTMSNLKPHHCSIASCNDKISCWQICMFW